MSASIPHVFANFVDVRILSRDRCYRITEATALAFHGNRRSLQRQSRKLRRNLRSAASRTGRDRGHPNDRDGLQDSLAGQQKSELLVDLAARRRCAGRAPRRSPTTPLVEPLRLRSAGNRTAVWRLHRDSTQGRALSNTFRRLCQTSRGLACHLRSRHQARSGATDHTIRSIDR